jgi:type I restriction enzyme S subunit
MKALFRLKIRGIFETLEADPVPLGSLGKWVGGGTPSKANSAFWSNGKIPWVSPKDMKYDVIASAEDYITEIAVEKSSTTIVPPDSLLMVTRSGILQHTFPVSLAGCEVAINQDIKALIPNDKFSPLFVAEFMRSHQEEILQTCAKVGTTVESIDTDALKNFEIPLPEINVQQAVSELIRVSRSFIAGSEHRKNLLVKQKQGLMQKLLTGKVRAKV